MDNGASSYRRFLEGDEDGLVELIREYKDGLILFLNRYVRNIHTAEELAEVTFFRLVIRKPRYVARYAFKTWLYTIGRNLALKHLKWAGRMTPVTLEELELLQSQENALEQAVLKEEGRIALHRALSALRSDYSQVLHLRFFEELPNDQIAVILKKNKRQVENLLYQAKQSLKSQLQKEGFCYEGL